MDNNTYTAWRNLIGDFLMEFARAEETLDRIIEDAFPNELNQLTPKPFKKRATFVITNIGNCINAPEISKTTTRSLNELIKLADNVRNIIAHHPLELSLEAIFSEEPQEDIRSRRNSKKTVTFQSLASSLKDLKKWSKNLDNCHDSISCKLYP